MVEKYQFDVNAQSLHKIDMRPDADELVTPGWGDYLQAGWGKLNNLSSTLRGDKTLIAPRRSTTVSAKPLTTFSAQCGAKPVRRQVESLYARPQGGINFYAPPPKDDDFPDLGDSLILNQLDKSKTKPTSDRKPSGFTRSGGLDGSLILGQLDKSKTAFKSNPLGFDDLLRETQGFSSTAVDGQALKEALKDDRESTPRPKSRPLKLKHMPPPSEAMATLAIGTKRKVNRSDSDEDIRKSTSKNEQLDASKRRRYNYVQVTADIPMDGNTQNFHETKGGRSPKQYLYGTSKVRRGIRTAASSATSVLRSPLIWWKKATEPRKTTAVANFDIPQNTVSFSDHRDTFIVGNLPDTDMDDV
jgi:hypothetical protein